MCYPLLLTTVGNVVPWLWDTGVPLSPLINGLVDNSCQNYLHTSIIRYFNSRHSELASYTTDPEKHPKFYSPQGLGRDS